MLNIYTQSKKKIKKIPIIGQLIAAQLYKKRYKTELALLNGTHITKNRKKSIIHFSFNRSATQYIKSILIRCARTNGMTPVGINDFAFHTNFPYLGQLSAKDMENYEHIFKQEGYIYSVFGGMVEGIPSLEKYKIILVSRDPRDILVSWYYSIGYSHPLPDLEGNKRAEMNLWRKTALNSSIDEFVIAESDRLYKKFLKYNSLLIDKYKNVQVTRYETMVAEFDIWLKDILNYCELEITEKLFEELLNENEKMRPKCENIYNQLRKGKPKDYLNKLKPDTIRYLNNKFSFILNKYNYR